MYPTTDFAVVPWYVVYTIFVDSFFNHSIECLTSLALACHKFIVLTSLRRSSTTINASPFPDSVSTYTKAISASMFHSSVRALFLRFPSGSTTINASPFPDSVLT